MNDALQAQMRKRRGSYSCNKHWMTYSILQAGSDATITRQPSPDKKNTIASGTNTAELVFKSGSWALAKVIAAIMLCIIHSQTQNSA